MKLKTVTESLQSNASIKSPRSVQVCEAVIRRVENMTEDELADVWDAIGGSQHRFDSEKVKKWLETGKIDDTLRFGAAEIFIVAKVLQAQGIKGDSQGYFQ